MYNYCLNWYKTKCQVKQIAPRALADRANLVARVLKLDDRTKIEFLNIMRKEITDINKTVNVKVNKAPQIKWNHMFDLAHSLWGLEFAKYKNQKCKRRAASVALFLTAYGGLRWADCFNLNWANMRVCKTSQGNFITIRMHSSKTNWKGSLNQWCTIPKLESNFKYCPVRFLLKYWKYVGKPSSGLLFGSVKSNAAARLVSIYAERQNWTINPKKHSNRIACATTLFKAGCDELSIDMHMNWISEFMRKYYIMDFINTRQNGPAHKLKVAAESNELFNFQKHMLSPVKKPNKPPY